MDKSRVITAEIASAHIGAEQALSALREQCYKLASAYFNESCEPKRQAAYALADKYQAVLDALGELEQAAIEIRDSEETSDRTAAYGSRYMVEQFVEHANQFEPIPEGGFDDRDTAVRGMETLVADLGWSDLRVVDLSNGSVIAQSNSDEWDD